MTSKERMIETVEWALELLQLEPLLQREIDMLCVEWDAEDEIDEEIPIVEEGNVVTFPNPDEVK